MFDRLGRFIAKRHRLILAAWVLVLLVSIPAIYNLDGRLVYNERSFLPDSMESVKASSILEEKFPGYKPPDLIVVIDGVEITNDKLKNAVLRVEDDLTKLSGIEKVTSPYDVYEEILESYWEVMNETYREVLKKTMNATSTLHDTLWTVIDQVNSSLRTIYGIPAAYLGAWSQLLNTYARSGAGLSAPLTEINERAKEVVLKGIPPVPEVQVYLNMTAEAWNAALTRILGPGARVGDAVLAIKEGKLDPASLMTSIVREMAPRIMGTKEAQALAVVNSFDLTNFSDPKAIERFTLEMVAKGAKEKGYNVSIDTLERLYRIGPNPTDQELRRIAEGMAEDIMREIVSSHPPPEFPSGIPEDLRKSLISKDGTAMAILISLRSDIDQDKTSLVDKVREIVASVLSEEGIGADHYVTGSAAFTADMKGSSLEDVKRIDQVTLILVIVLLVALLMSVIAPAVPLVTVGAGVMAAFASLYAESYAIDLIYLVRNLVIPLIMGVGVDYSIYMLYRYKEELEKGRDVSEAVVNSTRFAGEAVTSAALTVMAGFGALAAADFKLLQSMGYSLTVVVLVAMAAAITLTPSILALLGRRTFWPSKLDGRRKGGTRSSYLRRMAEISIRRPKVVIAVFLILTLVAGGVLVTMHRTYDYTELMPETESIKGLKVLSDKFEGLGKASVYAVIEFKEPVISGGELDRSAYDTLVSFISGVQGELSADDIRSIVTLNGTVASYSTVERWIKYYDSLLSEDHRGTVVVIQLPYKPYAEEALQAAGRIMEFADEFERDNGVKVYVGGETAATYEMNELVNRNFTYRIIPVAVVLILVVLYLLLRSASVASSLLLAIGTSISWALAALVVVFQYVGGKDVYWMTPIMLLTTLLGLGMDYGIFLVTRVKEELGRGLNRDEAIVKAVETTGMVITACGLIMAAAFGSLMLSNFAMLQEMGFAFSAAVLLDTFLVRPLFLPSLLRLLKWKPSKET